MNDEFRNCAVCGCGRGALRHQGRDRHHDYEPRTERPRSQFAIYLVARGYYVSGEFGQGRPGTLKTTSWIVESAAFDSYELAAQELARLGFTDCTQEAPTLNNAYVCHRSV